MAIFRIKVGKEIGSAALIADGYHARTDGLTSLAVVVGALLIIVGLVMIVAGAASSKSTPAFSDSGPGAFGGLVGGLVGGLIMLVYGVFVAIFLYAYAEWMYVFMDIEEDTRMTNEMLLERK